MAEAVVEAAVEVPVEAVEAVDSAVVYRRDGGGVEAEEAEAVVGGGRWWRWRQWWR